MSNPILEVKDFTVDFWVDGVWYPAAVKMNFDLHPGKVLAIVGESGSGKSTTALGLMSLLASNARMTGSVKVKDQEMEFNADSLEMEKDLNPDIKTEPVEHDEKELQNVKKNKIEKFNELK
jgi:peptide/nickel transport system ATP-binding protein